MDKNAVLFRQRVKPASHKSKLLPFADAIISLYRDGFTQKQIVQFLISNDIEVSRQMVSLFIIKNKKAKLKESPVMPPATLQQVNIPASEYKTGFDNSVIKRTPVKTGLGL